MHAAVLRYFDHVARHGSIRKAADALTVASSAVNRQILRLEDEMGVALFERGAAACARRRRASSCCATCARRERIPAHPGGDRQHRRHGERRCPHRLAGLAAGPLPAGGGRGDGGADPKVTFTVLSVHPSEIGEALRSGDNDFGVLFVDARHRGVEVLAEFPTAVGALMRPDHPLAARKP